MVVDFQHPYLKNMFFDQKGKKKKSKQKQKYRNRGRGACKCKMKNKRLSSIEFRVMGMGCPSFDYH